MGLDVGPDLTDGVGAGGFRGAKKFRKRRRDRAHLGNSSRSSRCTALYWRFGSGFLRCFWFRFSGSRWGGSGGGLGRSQEGPAAVENPSGSWRHCDHQVFVSLLESELPTERVRKGADSPSRCPANLLRGWRYFEFNLYFILFLKGFEFQIFIKFNYSANWYFKIYLWHIFKMDDIQ